MVGSTMRSRARWLVLPVAALAIAAATATASGGRQLGKALLVAGPVPVKAYQMQLTVATAGKASAGKPLTLSIMFVRRAGKANQMHFYTFPLAAKDFVASADLSKATLDTGSDLGTFGRIKMTFGNAGKLTSLVPTGCTGGFATRSGKLSGAYRLAADRTYFRTIVKTSLPAKLSRSTSGVPTCTTSPPEQKPTHGITLSGGNPQLALVTAAKPTGGPVTQSVMASEQRAPASLVHLITATVADTAFTVAADLQTARVEGAAGAPFLGGSLAFRAMELPEGVTVPTPPGATQQTVMGTLSGDYTAHFDSIGDRSPAAVDVADGAGAPGVLTKS